MILASEADVVILRYSSGDYRLVEEVECAQLSLRQADTLLYFEAEIPGPLTGAGHIRLSEAGEAGGELTALVKGIFSDYKNHYAASAIFDRIDTAIAYAEWVGSSLGEPEVDVLKASAEDGAPVGLVVLDKRDNTCAEILLAGILPEFRRKGLYQEMIRAALGRLDSQGLARVAISTQASNVEVMRAWCRLGFLPTVALNTVHVLRQRP